MVEGGRREGRGCQPIGETGAYKEHEVSTSFYRCS